MATQKSCNVVGCQAFIFAPLDDFEERGWTAFKVGKNPILHYCPNHNKESGQVMFAEMQNQGKRVVKK